MAASEQLARIIDECEHGSTAAFCGPCKAQTRMGESVARRRRRAIAESWGTEGSDLPYKRILARFRAPCPDCDEYVGEQDPIYKVGQRWVCESCAHDSAVMGEK